MTQVRKAYKVRWPGWELVKYKGKTSYHARNMSEKIRLSVRPEDHAWVWKVYDRTRWDGFGRSIEVQSGRALTWAMARHAAERYGKIYDEKV